MKKIELEKNNVVFSSLSEFYEPVQSNGFGIKYVVEGSELYNLNEQKFLVEAGNYLLCNSAKTGKVLIESRQKVKGICINIEPELIMQAIASLISPDSLAPNQELGNFFSSAHFLENQYQAKATNLGKLLLTLSKDVANNNFSSDKIDATFFYELVEKIIADQVPIFKQLQSLPSVKLNTKKDVYKKLLRGKELIDSSFTNPLSIPLLAKEACISEFHFYRLFKQMMGITPHQYILNKRLELGKQILSSKHFSVSEAAIECGFSDVFSFSKSFKKQFGVTPSSLVKH